MNDHKSNDTKQKQLKSIKSLTLFPTSKSQSRKKTITNKEKSQTKKTRKVIHKQKAMKNSAQKECIEKINRFQYYNNTKNYDKNMSGNISDLNINQYMDNQNAYCGFEDDVVGRSPKLKLTSIKGVISFDGKMVKNQLKGRIGNDYHKNYTQWQNSSHQIHKQFLKSSKSRKKSQSRKNKSKSRIIKNQNSQKLPNNQFYQKKTTKNHSTLPNVPSQLPHTKQQSDQTVSTPNNFHLYCCYYQRKQQIIDITILKQQITAESNKKITKKSNNIINQYREIGIKIVSRICGAMGYRKQTFALAVEIFDMYINDHLLLSKVRLLALACLELALKLQQGENAYNFMIYLNGSYNRANSNYTTQRSTSHHKKQRKPSRQKLHKNTQQQQTKPQNKKKSQQLNPSQYNKFIKILTEQFQIPSSTSSLEALEDKLNRKQMLEYETLIFMKLGYQLQRRTYIYWVDMLTILWDQFVTCQAEIYQNSAFGNNIQVIVFRWYKNCKNMAYLAQILECCLLSEDMYAYDKVVLVLSVMYMLVRINMENILINAADGNISDIDEKKSRVHNQEKNIFAMYRKTLQKSSNVLFIDRVGCNVLFGTFLLKLEIEMGQILSCCQFISNYLDPEPLLQHNYHNNNQTFQTHDHSLSLHFHNPKIYQYYSNK